MIGLTARSLEVLTKAGLETLSALINHRSH